MNMAEAANFFKTTCSYCSQTIEVPFDYIDDLVECPNCKRQTLASPAGTQQATVQAQKQPFQVKKSPKGRTPITIAAWVIVITAALAAIAGLVYLLIQHFTQTLGIVGGIGITLVGIILGVLAIIWALLWLVFPVFVYFGMNRMEALLRQIEQNTRKTKG